MKSFQKTNDFNATNSLPAERGGPWVRRKENRKDWRKLKEKRTFIVVYGLKKTELGQKSGSVWGRTGSGDLAWIPEEDVGGDGWGLYRVWLFVVVGLTVDETHLVKEIQPTRRKKKNSRQGCSI